MFAGEPDEVIMELEDAVDESIDKAVEMEAIAEEAYLAENIPGQIPGEQVEGDQAGQQEYFEE